MSDRPPDIDLEGNATPDPTVPVDALATSGSTLGPFLLRERIGAGGMGEVWRAEQTTSVRRTVALKLIKAGMDSREVLARFEAERQALALMDHPCIAKVFDAGTTPQGRPWFAMEYVRGIPITEYCDKHRLSTADRLQLFQRVCEGVQHAHQKAVLHRDLKPGNILVADVDEKPLPKIIDFGVAKATTQKLTEKTMYTAMGQLIGTPEYMSPEQAELTGEDVDTRTDVYSLGVVLYELLVGALPFESKDLRKAGFEGIRKMIREQDPPRPSTKLSTLGDQTTEIATHRRTGPKRLSSQLKGDLDWIVMRCLEKDRNRRYGSPQELGQDIRRHLEHEPVLAGPPSAAYRTRKFVRRNRVGVSVSAAALIVLVGFSATTAVQSRRIARERDRANREAETSERVSRFLSEMLGTVDPHRMGTTIFDELQARVAEALVHRSTDIDQDRRGFEDLTRGVNRTDLARQLLRSEILERATETIERDLSDQPLIAARLYRTLGNTYRKLGMGRDAVDQLEKAVEIRTRELGVDDPRTLEARHDHAMAHTGVFNDGWEPESDPFALIREVIATRRTILGPDHPQTLESLYSLGFMHHQAGQRAEADSVHWEAFEARRRILGQDHPATLRSMHAVADMDGHFGRWARADSLFSIALEKQERMLGSDHDETLACKLDMAWYYAQSQWRYEDAARLLQEVLETRRRLLGRDHPSTMYAAGVLADVYRQWHRHEDASRLQEENLEIVVRTQGEDHAFSAGQRINLAQPYMLSGREEDADRLFEAGIEILRRQHGPRDVRVARSMESWGATARVAKRYDFAVMTLEEALNIRREILGGGGTPPILSLLKAYRESSRFADAERLCQERIELLERDPDRDRASLMYWKQELGQTYLEWGRNEDAQAQLRAVVDGREQDDDDTRLSEALLARVLDAQGRRAEAEPLYRRYVQAHMDEIARSADNVKIKQTAIESLLENVPSELLDLDRVVAAAVDMNEITYFRSPLPLKTLALAYHLAGRREEAVEIQKKVLAILHPDDPTRSGHVAALQEYQTAVARGSRSD